MPYFDNGRRCRRASAAAVRTVSIRDIRRFAQNDATSAVSLLENR